MSLKEILVSLSMWQDSEGYIHTQKNPDVRQSENRALFTAEVFTLITVLSGRFKADKAGLGYPASEYVNYIIHGRHLSHDNATGIAVHQYLLGLDPLIPTFDMARAHPRDIIFYGLLKYPKLFWVFKPLLALIHFESCLATWKIRGDNKMRVTDGKLLAFIRMKALNLNWSYKICTWLIERNPIFGSWTNVAKIYFPNEGHPVPELMELYEKGIRTQVSESIEETVKQYTFHLPLHQGSGIY